MANSSVLSIRINEQDEQFLANMAEELGTSKSKLVAEAIHNYVEMNQQYRKLIEERIAAADRKEYASKARIDALYAKHGVERY